MRVGGRYFVQRKRVVRGSRICSHFLIKLKTLMKDGRPHHGGVDRNVANDVATGSAKVAPITGAWIETGLG